MLLSFRSTAGGATMVSISEAVPESTRCNEVDGVFYLLPRGVAIASMEGTMG